MEHFLNPLTRAWRWLIAEPEPLPAVAASAPAEIVEAEWRAAVESVRSNAYQIGLAEGELKGRIGLSHELEIQFGPQGGMEDFTAEDAARIRHRQVH